ncbi:MAG: hypothetical protein ACM3QZ_07030 [Solirubrobacterales bacterium]
MPTPSAAQALSILRDPSQFHWYVIPLFIIVFYIYSVEIGRKNWSIVFAGLALWGMDLFNEIWNGLIFHFSNYAPVWGTPGGGTAFNLLIGLNVEITFMFAVMGIAAAHLLPADKSARILGLPNRWVLAVANSIAAVIVEIILNQAGALTWEWPWWNAHNPWLIFLIGYLPFFAVSFWVHDMESRKKQAVTVGTILGFDLLCLIVFAGFLNWI